MKIIGALLLCALAGFANAQERDDWIGLYADPDAQIREIEVLPNVPVDAYFVLHAPTYADLGIMAIEFMVVNWPQVGPDGLMILEWDEALSEIEQQAAVNQLRGAVDRVPDLPADAEEPILLELSMSEIFNVAMIAVTDTGGVGEYALREVARGLERKLEQVPGVTIVVSGFPRAQDGAGATIARHPACLTAAGDGKSGCPALKSRISRPSARRRAARSLTARVADGASSRTRRASLAGGGGIVRLTRSARACAPGIPASCCVASG